MKNEVWHFGFQKLCAAVFLFAGTLVLSIWFFRLTMPVPVQISDADFGRLVSDFSEAGGWFPWDNVVKP